MISNRRKAIITFVLLIFWLALMFVLSSQNGEETVQVSGGVSEFIAKLIYNSPTAEQMNFVHLIIRKIAHLVLYFMFGTLLSLFMRYIDRLKPIMKNGISALSVIIISFADELHKLPISGRHFDLFDVLLNIIGGMLAVFAVFMLSKMIEKRQNKRLEE